MRNLGIAILLLGLLLGAYSLSMEVAVDVPARDLGYGIKTPAMQVANIDRMSQRQNYMIFSGILSVVGAILLGFGSMQTRQAPAQPAPPSPRATGDGAVASEPTAPQSLSICPKCRHMGGGDDKECARCGVELPA